MSYTSSEARSKEQLLKIFEVIEGAKEKFSRGKNGKEVVSKLTSTTSDTLKRKVDEAFELTRDEQNSKIVKKIIGLPMEIWMALLEGDGDMNLWFQLMIKAEKNIEDKKSIYSEKVISKVKFIVNDVFLKELIAKLGDSLKYVKHLTIKGNKWTLQQYIEIYNEFKKNFDALKTTQLETLTLLKCNYVSRFLDVKFTSGLKKLVIIGNCNFAQYFYKRIGVVEENEIIYNEKKVERYVVEVFYMGPSDRNNGRNETSIDSEIFCDGKLTELFVQDVTIVPKRLERDFLHYDEWSKNFFIKKATFLNAYPTFTPLKVDELAVKNINPYIVDGGNTYTLYADYCHIYKCEIYSRRGGENSDRKDFDIPECRILFIDNSLYCANSRIQYLLRDSNFVTRTEAIYINNTALFGFRLSETTLEHLKFISFDMNDDEGYREAINFCTSHGILVQRHSDEEFKLLINNTFKNK
jgi:hypothetical protein